MIIKNFRQLFLPNNIEHPHSGSDPELLIVILVHEVVPPLAILLLHVTEILTRSHRYEVPVPDPPQFLFKLYHGM